MAWLAPAPRADIGEAISAAGALPQGTGGRRAAAPDEGDIAASEF